MVQVYVTEIPHTKEECPFFNNSTEKCNITNGECCLTGKPDCMHLINLSFGIVEDYEIVETELPLNIDADAMAIEENEEENDNIGD